MQTMVNNLIVAFRERLQKLDWMSDDTRKQAIAKLNAFGQKIGYPEKWIDYSKLDVSRESYLANILRASEFEQMRDFNKINKPVNPIEWTMTPPTVNAYNSSLRTRSFFRRASFRRRSSTPQPMTRLTTARLVRSSDTRSRTAMTTRAVTSTFSGNLKNWWTESDKKNFDSRAECVINQFSAFEAEPGLKLQGKLVSGESIADLGGLHVAYDAFHEVASGKTPAG